MPNGSRTVLATGELDTISPPRVAHDYAARAKLAGDQAEVLILPGASHYDEIAASSNAWRMILPVTSCLPDCIGLTVWQLEQLQSLP